MTSTIHTHRWHPEEGVEHRKRGVYLLHGIGEHAGRYERLATTLTALGYVVGAHDHPGHGRSTGKRGVIYSDEELELTGVQQLEIFKAETGATPYLFGHSLGGLVATSMVLNHHVMVAGLLLSAPAYSPIISPFNKLKLAVMKLVAPRLAMELPYYAENLTHDETEQSLGRTDPLNHKYKSASIVMWLLRTGRQAVDKASTLTVPTLILLPGDDPVIDSAETLVFADNVADSLITLKQYGDYRHEVLNETPDRRRRVLDDITQWLSDQE